MKTAYIIGITGQDGAYLAQLLLSHGYRVIGVIQKGRELHTKNLDCLRITSHIIFEHCNLLNVESISLPLTKYMPNEIYNLAAYSSVGRSYSIPIETLNFNIISVASLLESIREIIYYIFEKLDISKEKIIVNEQFFRPNEIENIYGDASKAKAQLGWEYNISFFEVLDILIEEEKKYSAIISNSQEVVL